MKQKETTAMGWMYHFACQIQDQGLDIRTIDVENLLEEFCLDFGFLVNEDQIKRAAAELDWSKGQRFMQCPQCKQSLYAYLPDREGLFFSAGGGSACDECGWSLKQEKEKQDASV